MLSFLHQVLNVILVTDRMEEKVYVFAVVIANRWGDGEVKHEKRYAIQYGNKMYHCWDKLGDFDYARTVDEAHLVNTQRAAKEIANVIREETGSVCTIVEVEYAYMFVRTLEKRSR